MIIKKDEFALLCKMSEGMMVRLNEATQRTQRLAFANEEHRSACYGLRSYGMNLWKVWKLAMR